MPFWIVLRKLPCGPTSGLYIPGRAPAGLCGDSVAPETARLFQATVPLYSPTAGGLWFLHILASACHLPFRVQLSPGWEGYSVSHCGWDPQPKPVLPRPLCSAPETHTSLEVTAAVHRRRQRTAAGRWGREEGRGAAKGRGTRQGMGSAWPRGALCRCVRGGAAGLAPALPPAPSPTLPSTPRCLGQPSLTQNREPHMRETWGFLAAKGLWGCEARTYLMSRTRACSRLVKHMNCSPLRKSRLCSGCGGTDRSDFAAKGSPCCCGCEASVLGWGGLWGHSGH